MSLEKSLVFLSFFFFYRHAHPPYSSTSTYARAFTLFVLFPSLNLNPGLFIAFVSFFIFLYILIFLFLLSETELLSNYGNRSDRILILKTLLRSWPIILLDD